MQWHKVNILGVMAVKKRIFTLFSLLLCFCFVFSGCNLFISDPVKRANDTAVDAGRVTLTREELLKGYSSYYSTFYNNSKDSTKAFEDLVEYLVSKKLYILDAEELLDTGKIRITEIENNYIWYSVYTALINNIETFEGNIREELDIEDEEEDEEKTQESQFVYTPYEKLAKVVFDQDSGEYKLVKINKVMVEITNDDGEKEYKYIDEDEVADYPFSGVVFDMDYIKNKIEEVKLFKGQDELTDEQEDNKAISKEALRRYIVQLKKNEEGRDLSKDDASIYNREILRIYKIIYENLLINKLYDYKVSEVSVSEEDVLNLYLEKVKATYERYLLDPSDFAEELTKTVKFAKLSGYSAEPNCVEDIFYVPENDDEEFFFITHIVISLSEFQIQQINELKQYCEANAKSEEYYQEEFDKIVDKSKIKLDERDKDGYIVVKSTDDDAITLEQMLQNLEDDLQAIRDKYPSAEKGSVAYNNELADKFNEYIYKYSDDEGTIQIQTSITGSKYENWYLYGLGTDETDAGFVEDFVDKARELHENGEIGETGLVLMQNWKTENDVETLNKQSTGYSMIMYCGKVANLFESFDDKKFDLNDLFAEEGSEGKYYSLLKMDLYRLGLTMNKTLFDLMYEECYKSAYNEIITRYEDSVLKDLNIVRHENVYSDVIK
jgi:hypothetical protein